MLEILILINLARKIGAIVEEKGRKKGGYQFMLVAFWFGGEIFGGFLGGMIGVLFLHDEGPAKLLAYGLALVCAIIGAVVAFQIAKNLEPVPGEEMAVDLHGADLDRWGSHFKPNDSPSPAAEDAYTRKPERTPPADDRIQQ